MYFLVTEIISLLIKHHLPKKKRKRKRRNNKHHYLEYFYEYIESPDMISVLNGNCALGKDNNAQLSI